MENINKDVAGKVVVVEEEEFSHAMELATRASFSMVLQAAIDLQVLETIAKAGPNAQLSPSQIASLLALPNPDAPSMLDRMLRLLATYSILTCDVLNVDDADKSSSSTGGGSRVYGLAPVAKYFVPNEDGVSLGPLISLLQDKVFTASWYKLKDSVKEGGVPFDKVHGTHAFEYPATDPRFNDVFNTAMFNHTTLVIKQILRTYHGFHNLTRLVDVGGGLGVTLGLITSQHPNIKGVNFDLPHVIQHAPTYPGVEHIGGDMFQSVPKGDAIFMKWILHDWSDDHCLKLLKNCYQALPDSGKVIVVEAILPVLPNTSHDVRVASQTDAIMMTQNPGGKERTEDEFLALAKGAGFSSITKACFARGFWVIEFNK